MKSNDCWIALFCLILTTFLPDEKYKIVDIELVPPLFLIENHIIAY